MAKYFFVAVAAALLCHLCLASAASGTAEFSPPIAASDRCSQTNKKEYLASANDEIWANGKACGATYCVVCRGPGTACQGTSSINARIISHCPNCKATISITQSGFAQLVGFQDPSIVGIVDIEYFDETTSDHCA